MSKDYFKDCKAITTAVLKYLESNNQFDEDLYYTIDILDVDGQTAKVMLCDDCLYLTKEAGEWNMPALEQN